MSPNISVPRELLERLAPADCQMLRAGGTVCGWCDTYQGRVTDTDTHPHRTDCAWVAARVLLDAPSNPVLHIHIDEPAPRVIVVPVERLRR